MFKSQHHHICYVNIYPLLGILVTVNVFHSKQDWNVIAWGGLLCMVCAWKITNPQQFPVSISLATFLYTQQNLSFQQHSTSQARAWCHYLSLIIFWNELWDILRESAPILSTLWNVNASSHFFRVFCCWFLGPPSPPCLFVLFLVCFTFWWTVLHLMNTALIFIIKH